MPFSHLREKNDFAYALNLRKGDLAIKILIDILTNIFNRLGNLENIRCILGLSVKILYFTLKTFRFLPYCRFS